MTTYKERENRLIAEMENRTAYNDGLTIPELCKRVLGYEMQVCYDRNTQRIVSKAMRLYAKGMTQEADKLYSSIDIESNNNKSYEDSKRIRQIKAMLKRTRDKYKSGSRYNDTTIDRHQYWLIPPKLQEKDRLWRCIHLIPAINAHLFEPLLMRSEQQTAGLEKRGRRLEKLAKIPEEEMERRLQEYEDRILEGAKTREQVKKKAEEQRRKEAEKHQKKMSDYMY